MAGATVTIQYAGTNKVLDKPFIVVEGFDAWKIVHPDDPTKNFKFLDFMDFQIPGAINIPLGNGQDLNDALESNGYDIVFVDFNEGTDYIQRNAYLVENIIQWVNSIKAPYTTKKPNVVLGMSMGGLVARYALRDMEVRNLAHDTRLYISHDAPHQGANVPLAAQAAVRHLAGITIGVGVPGIYYTFPLRDLNKDLDKAYDLLQTPAAMQMLKYQLSGAGSSILINNSAHTTFMSEYRNLGLPVQARNVAIASGSECAELQAFGPYATLLNFDDGFTLKYWQGLLSSVISPFTSYTPQLFLGFPLTTRTDLKANINLHALPDKLAQQIYRGKIYVAKKILFVININLTLADKAINSSSAMLPLDSAPGGIYDVEAFGGLPDEIFGVSLGFNYQRFNFVPATSSLDIGKGQQTITTADLTRSYSPSSPPAAPKNVPFANFFTNTISNENHIQFTQNNGNWVLGELSSSNPKYNCAQFCSAVPNITGGAAYVCYSSNTTFSLSNAAGLTTQWRTSNNLFVVSRTNTNITVKAASATAAGNGWIEASVSNSAGCQLDLTGKNVLVGTVSTSNITVSGQVAVCPGNQYTYTALPSGSGYTYNWTYPSGWTKVSQSGNQIALYVPSNSPSGGAVSVSINNGCGASGYAGITVYPVTCSASTSAFVVYPNPTEGEIYIEPNPAADTVPMDSSTITMGVTASSFAIEETIAPVEEFNVVLYNDQQEIVATAISVNQKVSLDASQLPAGMYYLHILYQDIIEQKKVIIE